MDNEDTPSISCARLQRLRAALAAHNIDALCVRDTPNIAWATAFDGVFDSERAHALLVTQDASILHTDSRYSAACRTAAQAGPIAIDCEGDPYTTWLAGLCASNKALAEATTLGIEDTCTLTEFRKLEAAFAPQSAVQPDQPALQPTPRIVETTDIVSALRAVKDAREIARLRAAQAITDAAFAHIVEWVRPGMTEIQVKVELEDYMLRHGATGLAFPSIVATGPNGANPHAQPTDTSLEAGQCVVMDFGAYAGGYCSDMTRMLFIGQPDAELARAYEVLRAVNEEVEATLKPGVTGAKAHQLALAILGQGGFGGMGHGLGHGVGIEVHEDPVLAPRNTQPLQVGNVVTVEPGIYKEGQFGMRLEDFGVVTENGFEVFTQTSHEMVVV